MTMPVDAILKEALTFFCRLSIRQGLSARQSLQRYRDAGGQVSNQRFYSVFNAEKGRMLR